VVGLLLLEAVYLLGVGLLRERFRWAERIDRRQAAIFSLGVLVLAVALLPPLHDLSEEYLFSAHMLQHMLVVLVAVPLLLVGTPDWLLRPLLRPWAVLGLTRFFTRPVVACVVFNVVFYIWHVPALYDVAVRHDGVHALEHVTLLASAMLMWWPVLGPMAEFPRLSYPLQMLYLFLLTVVQKPLFGVITFSSRVLYASYADAPRLWGISALEDQQVGGVIMAVGSMAVFLGVLVAVFFRWFNREEETAHGWPEPPDVLERLWEVEKTR
jgi:putative membrane protein